jgi:hypothetical protein
VSSYSKFLRRVRIHGRECGAVARALPHTIEANPLSAADKKVLSTTNERKVMSNSTFFKRIALTAIAALGFGMLSVAPSQAVVTSHTLTIDAATDSIALGETASAVLAHSFVNLGDVNDSVTIIGVVTSSNAASSGNIAMRVTDSYTSLGNTGGASVSPSYFIAPNTAGGTETTTGSVLGVDAPLGSGNRSDRLADSLTVGFIGSANRSVGTEISVDLYNPSAAGTYTISFYTLTSAGGATAVSSTPAVTWTVTVTATAATAAASASTVTLRNGNATAAGLTYFGGTAEGTDSQTLAARSTSTTTTTPGFTLFVKQKDGLTSALGNIAQESYTVTVTGEAWVTAGTVGSGGTKGGPAAAETRPTSATGVKWLRMATPVADSATIVRVWSTGTAGTATITVTSDAGLVLGTKTVTFHGPVTALAINRTTKKVIEAGTSTASTAAFRVAATDAGGRAVTGLTVGIISSNVAAVSGGSCADAVGAVTDGIYSCDVNPVVTSTSGMASTLTARTLNPADLDGLTYLTVTYDVTMGGAVSTFVLTTDKATYDPGASMVLTATAKDASGNAPFDGQAGPTLRSNKALGGTAAGTSITMNAYYDGVSTSQTRSATTVRTMSADLTLFAPAASGTFSISGLDGQTTPASVSVTATVGDDGATAAANAASDAAAEAIDAANAATDAANLAAEAADAATVAAEEARDAADAATAAVEALATEVATLMAALKAQITTLANTVAKIAKKVKA